MTSRVGSPHERGRVLVVDDEAPARTTLVALLGLDYEVAEAASGAAADQLFAAGSYDVLVADYQLGPGDTGLALLDRIGRSHPATQGILLTGHSGYQEVRRVQESGRFIVLFKPADPDQLVAWVRNAVAMARLARAKSRSESTRLSRPGA